MAFIEPVTLSGRHVRLEPLAMDHHDALVDAASDGELWKLWYTSVPAPEAMVGASGAMLIFGGASMMLGVKPQLGALAVIGFLASVSPTIHDFWHAEDEGQRSSDTMNFAKNMALAGAAVAFLGRECDSGKGADAS